MMGTEDDTASEEGTAQVCSHKHTPKATLPCWFFLCWMSLTERVARARVLLCAVVPKAFLLLLKYPDELRMQHKRQLIVELSNIVSGFIKYLRW